MVTVGSIWRCRNKSHCSLVVRVLQYNGRRVVFSIAHRGPQKHKKPYSLAEEKFLMCYQPEY